MFDRLDLFISDKEKNLIKKLNILIVGIGGVGGYVFESLIRTGVENITIIDGDVIELSNINRQIISLNSTLLQKKVLVAKARALDINPSANIVCKDVFLDKNNINIIDYNKYDYIIDACDTITTKILLIKKAKENNIKIISCMGTGNRLNPQYLIITKISKTYNDPVAKIMRKLLKEQRIKDVLVCWSSELPRKNHSRTPGSVIFVPATAGILIASYIIRETIKDV